MVEAERGGGQFDLNFEAWSAYMIQKLRDLADIVDDLVLEAQVGRIAAVHLMVLSASGVFRYCDSVTRIG